jgi:hypothetical protein
MPILIVAAIGLSILTTSICVNSDIARSTYESWYGGRFGGYGGMGFGGTGYGGVAPVIQEPVVLDKAINKFYYCLSHTHEDPPTVQKVDGCYYQTVGSNGDRQT